MAITPDNEQLAREAADEVYAQLLAMFAAHKQGEVAAVLGANELKVEPRPKQIVKRWKLHIGNWKTVETVR